MKLEKGFLLLAFAAATTGCFEKHYETFTYTFPREKFERDGAKYLKDHDYRHPHLISTEPNPDYKKGYGYYMAFTATAKNGETREFVIGCHQPRLDDDWIICSDRTPQKAPGPR